MTAAPSLQGGSFDVPTKAASKKGPGSKSGKAGKVKKETVIAGDKAELEAEEAAEIDTADAPQWMLADPVLSAVIKKLKGKVYKCFHSLDPALLLAKRAAVGHQLQGASWLQATSYEIKVAGCNIEKNDLSRIVRVE